MTPPRLPLLLSRLLLPGRWREVIAGDLEEEWRTSPHPSHRHVWGLTLRSIAICWIAAVRPRPRRQVEPAPHRGDSAMRSLLQDVQYGFRMMRKSPGFTLAAVVTLALGIGANAAIFSLVKSIVLEPLPYRDPSRVALLQGWDTEEDRVRFTVRLADFLDLRRQARSFDSLATYSYLTANLTGGDIPERVQAYRVSAGLFETLGVSAALGRVFSAAAADDDERDVAVISHGLWQRRFGGDRGILGQRVTLNGEPHEIIGVMPPSFEFPIFNFKGDLWIPWDISGGARTGPDALRGATVIGRLRDDATYASAQAELDVLMRGFADAYPASNRTLGVRLVELGRLDDEIAGPALVIVSVTVGIVLLLACANVANLLLARGVSRQRELSVRAALGASRARIARQLLVEGLLLAMAGGAAGLVGAAFALDALVGVLPEIVIATQPNLHTIGVDPLTIGFALAMAVLTTVVFGMVPAWRASREGAQEGLKESAAAGGSRQTRRLRTGLVVTEVALSTLLLVCTGLLVRTNMGLLSVDPGFSPDGVMTMAMTLPRHKYPNEEQLRQFYEQVVERVEQLPGVEAAAVVNVLPFSTYDTGTRLVIDGEPAPEPGRGPSAAYRVASPSYFATMRIPIGEGRAFDRRDRADTAPVVIVNRTFVRRYLAGASPIGRRLRAGSGEAPWRTVVGVVGDVRHSALTSDEEPEIYVPAAQAPEPMMMLAVRSAGRAADLVAPAQAAIRAIDPDQPVYHVKPLAQLVDESMVPQSASAGLMLLFSVLALLLAAVGVYGVMAYGVSQQTREFGVRLALGATPRDLLLVVARNGLMMVAAGVALGAVAAFGASRLMAGVLFGVTPSDPMTYAAVIGVLVVTGLAASGVPAWRASRTEAMAALRME